MKAAILYQFREGAWGGGNQFLKALRKEFIRLGVYVDPEDADVVLFNSHQHIKDVIALKQRFPEKRFVHRVDGPVVLVRGGSNAADRKTFLVNNAVANATIFQTHWSLEQTRALGYAVNGNTPVIPNAVDHDIFHPRGRISWQPHKRRIRLIAVSWSSNWRKGFEAYQWLDKNLDLRKYEFTFVGNSPIEFENINALRSVDSESLADLLRQHDIYVTASRSDPCSNSLLEALSCGLPAVAVRDGGHPELVKCGGALFDPAGEYAGEHCLWAIDRVANDRLYAAYQNRINVSSMSEVAAQYIQVLEDVYESHPPPHPSSLRFSRLRWQLGYQDMRLATRDALSRVLG